MKTYVMLSNVNLEVINRITAESDEAALDIFARIKNLSVKSLLEIFSVAEELNQKQVPGHKGPGYYYRYLDAK